MKNFQKFELMRKNCYIVVITSMKINKYEIRMFIQLESNDNI